MCSAILLQELQTYVRLTVILEGLSFEISFGELRHDTSSAQIWDSVGGPLTGITALRKFHAQDFFLCYPQYCAIKKHGSLFNELPI